MTITNLFKQLRQGVIPESKFLYEARRDANLPWILNTTSFKDAVQILKNKGIIREDQSSDELAKGIEVEMEHTNDPEMARKIAQDHLMEDPMYYTKLNTIGLEEDEENETMDPTQQEDPGNLDEAEKMVFDELGAEIEALQKKIKDLMQNIKDKKWIAALNSASTSLSNLDAKLSQANSKLGVMKEYEAINEEIDRNNSVFMKIRAAKDKKTSAPKTTNTKNASKIKDLQKQKAQIMRDMEQEAEPEGGDIADEYGDKLDKIDIAINKANKALNESHRNEETVAIIDTLNPYVFKKALEYELGKLKLINDDSYAATVNKVAKKLQKDPKAYINVQFPNSKEVVKYDAKMQMQVVKKDNHKDAHRQMEKIKAFKDALSNVKAPKTENKKGKPKDVKELSMVAKTAKGITKQFELPGKEKIVEAFYKDLFKKKVRLAEDMHPTYGNGQQVPLPKIDREHFGCDTGTVSGIVGGTLDIQLEVLDEQGQPIVISRQVNSIEDAKNITNEEHAEINEPVKASSGEFRSGDKVKDKSGNEITIKGFKKVGDDIHALVSSETDQYYKNVNVNDISPIEDQKAKDKAERDAFFNKMPNIGAKGQNWLSSMSKEDKLKEVVNRLKKFTKKQKEVDEGFDTVVGRTKEGGETVLSTVAQGKGSAELQNIKKAAASKGGSASSLTVKTIV